MEDGIKINGVTVNNFRYADDTVLLTDSLEAQLDCVVAKCNDYGLNLNPKKTKYMIISKQQVIVETLTVGTELLYQTSTINYLGTIIDDRR